MGLKYGRLEKLRRRCLGPRKGQRNCGRYFYPLLRGPGLGLCWGEGKKAKWRQKQGFKSELEQLSFPTWSPEG